MSYDKNTIKLSNLDGYIELLTELKIPFLLEYLGMVDEHGQNDNRGAQFYNSEGAGNFCPISTSYSLRKLTVKDIVYVEQMQRTSDCDCDDYIVLLKFEKDNVPSNIPLEIIEDLE